MFYYGKKKKENGFFFLNFISTIYYITRGRLYSVVINTFVVLATKYEEVRGVWPVVTNVSEGSSRGRDALPGWFLAQPFVVVIAYIDERPSVAIHEACPAVV